jgi:CRP-like cAMP-binding protein
VLRKDAKIELLRRVPLFEQCSRKELARISQLTTQVSLPEGRKLTVEGQRGREFFVLVEGNADVRRKGRRVNVLTRGDFLGELALVSDRPRTATVTALTPVEVLVMHARDFRTLLGDVPSLQPKILEAVAARLPDPAFV